jgi:hypothetical protein
MNKENKLTKAQLAKSFKDASINKIVNKFKQSSFARDKYNDKAGCYCIYIDNKLAYIGQSVNLIYRIAEHYYEMNKTRNKKHMYDILNESRKNGHKVWFDVIYYTNKTDAKNIRKDIIAHETYFINKYSPPLNISKGKKNDSNEHARTITLDEILLIEDIKIESAYKEKNKCK